MKLHRSGLSAKLSSDVTEQSGNFERLKLIETYVSVCVCHSDDCLRVRCRVKSAKRATLVKGDGFFRCNSDGEIARAGGR